MGDDDLSRAVPSEGGEAADSGSGPYAEGADAAEPRAAAATAGQESVDEAGRVRGLGAIFGPTINALLAPSRCWQVLEARPVLSIWIVAWVSVVSTVLAFVNLPITKQATLAIARSSMQARGGDISAEQLQQTQRAMETGINFVAYLTPVFIVVLMSLMALLLWVGASLMGGSSRFPRSFGLAAGAAVVHPTLLSVYATIILHLNPPEIRRPADMALMAPTVGPHLFFTQADLPVWLMTLLTHMDLFNIWWVAMVAMGAVVMLRLSKAQGVTLGLLTWGLTTGLAMLMATLGASSGSFGA
ncbi:MAG: hypothetical protein ACE5HV_08890 [Acidobacteriota bacterium]